MGSANHAYAANYRRNTIKPRVDPMPPLRLVVAEREPYTLTNSLNSVAQEMNLASLWFCELISLALALAALSIVASGAQLTHRLAGIVGLLFFGTAAIAAAYMMIVKLKPNTSGDFAKDSSEGEATTAD